MIIQFKHHMINSRSARQFFCCWGYVKHLHLWYLVPLPGLKYLAKRNQFLPENLQAYSLPCWDFILCFKSNFCSSFLYFSLRQRSHLNNYLTGQFGHSKSECLLKAKCPSVRKQKCMGCQERGFITLADHTKPLDTFCDLENNKSWRQPFTPANKLNKAWHLGKVNGFECKLQSLFNSGGVCDSKEQAGKTPAEGPSWSSPDTPVG